jgi:hypothetical protein
MKKEMQESRSKTWRVVQSSIGSEIARNDPQFLFPCVVFVPVLVLVLTTKSFYMSRSLMTLDSDISEHDDCLACFESAGLVLITFYLLPSEAPRQTRQPCFDHIAKFFILFWSISI